MGQMNHLSQY